MNLLRHEPSRGIGGAPKRSEDSPPWFDSIERGQTANHRIARTVNLQSGGRFINITEDVHKHATEPSGARQIIHRMTRRANRGASQHTISKEEALQHEIAEKPKDFMEAGAMV